MKIKKKCAVIIVTLSLFALTFVLIMTQAWNELALNNYDHKRGCLELPTREEARETFNEVYWLVVAIKEVNQGTTDVALQDVCPGRSDFLIIYGSANERTRILKMIRGTKLEKQPIRWKNI